MSFSSGQLRDAQGRLATSTNATGAAWRGGHVRQADGTLVVTTNATGATWRSGFLRAPSGALVITTNVTGAAVRGGVLRAPSGAVVVSTQAVAAWRGGLPLTASGALSVSSSGAVLTAVKFFGDSFTAGSPGPSDLAHRFSTRTAVGLGVAEQNYGAGGARQYLNTGYIHTAVLQAIAPPGAAPYAPVAQCAVVQASINNLNEPAVITDLGIVTRNLRAAIRRVRAAGTYEAANAGGTGAGAQWSFDAGWFAGAGTDGNSGAGNMRTTTNGSVWTLNVPADFPGGTLRLYGIKITNSGSIQTIRVDGAVHGTVDNRNGTAADGSDCWEYRIAGLAAGAHTITGTVSSLVTVDNINGADFEYGDTPLIIVLNTARAPGYPGGVHSIVDADVVNSNAAVAAMLAADFPGDTRIKLVDIDAVLGKNAAYFGVDTIHPNDTGAQLIADAIVAAVNAAWG